MLLNISPLTEIIQKIALFLRVEEEEIDNVT